MIVFSNDCFFEESKNLGKELGVPNNTFLTLVSLTFGRILNVFGLVFCYVQ